MDADKIQICIPLTVIYFQLSFLRRFLKIPPNSYVPWKFPEAKVEQMHR